MAVQAGLLSPMIPMSARLNVPDIPGSIAQGNALKQQSIETDDMARQANEANNDRQVLQSYDGDLYSVEGLKKASQDLKGKVSLGTYGKLQEQAQKLSDHDLQTKAKIQSMSEGDLKLAIDKNNLVFGQLLPVLDTYGKTKEAKGQQEADAEFAKNRAGVMQNLASQKDSQGKPLIPPEQLQSMAAMSPDQLSATAKMTKSYHDMAETKWKESQTKANEALVTQREATAAKMKDASAPDKLHIREIDAAVAQGYITPEAGEAAKAGILGKLATGGDASKPLGKETLSLLAEQYLAGDRQALSGLGFGKVGAANRAAAREEITRVAKERGMSGPQIAQAMAEFEGAKSGERALGTRTASLGMAASAANKFADLVLEASNNVNRIEYPDLNKVLIAGERKTGDPNVVKFGIAVNSFINAYARAINPQGAATVSDKDHARELLSTAFSKGQIDAAIEQLQKEIAAEQAAPKQVKKEMRDLAGVDQPHNAVGPGDQKSRDSDAVTILQDEIAKQRVKAANAKDTPEDPGKVKREQDYLAAAERELARTVKTAGGKASEPAKPAAKKLTYDPATGTFK